MILLFTRGLIWFPLNIPAPMPVTRHPPGCVHIDPSIQNASANRGIGLHLLHTFFLLQENSSIVANVKLQYALKQMKLLYSNTIPDSMKVGAQLSEY